MATHSDAGNHAHMSKGCVGIQRTVSTLLCLQTIKASQKGTCAIVMHPQDGVTAVDPYGVVRVMDDRPDRDPQNSLLNCFHVYSGQNMDPKHSSIPATGCSIVDAYIVNGLDRPLLMACSADGAVYVWEKCGCYSDACWWLLVFAHFCSHIVMLWTLRAGMQYMERRAW